ncbi:hypothetical protein HZH66_009794 [Vespula vulgaris]|uniref:Uncharacterized protein n=1 Tax=Vespula vulgaris TaxID=7454 RepID=A0A834JN38_VESVU|nr:hypothetical protein HZH66_009794 [Vespula vulgaris]
MFPKHSPLRSKGWKMGLTRGNSAVSLVPWSVSRARPSTSAPPSPSLLPAATAAAASIPTLVPSAIPTPAPEPAPASSQRRKRKGGRRRPIGLHCYEKPLHPKRTIDLTLGIFYNCGNEFFGKFFIACEELARYSGNYDGGDRVGDAGGDVDGGSGSSGSC